MGIVGGTKSIFQKLFRRKTTQENRAPRILPRGGSGTSKQRPATTGYTRSVSVPPTQVVVHNDNFMTGLLLGNMMHQPPAHPHSVIITHDYSREAAASAPSMPSPTLNLSTGPATAVEMAPAPREVEAAAERPVEVAPAPREIPEPQVNRESAPEAAGWAASEPTWSPPPPPEPTYSSPPASYDSSPSSSYDSGSSSSDYSSSSSYDSSSSSFSSDSGGGSW
jgi:hypothetical protein